MAVDSEGTLKGQTDPGELLKTLIASHKFGRQSMPLLTTRKKHGQLRPSNQNLLSSLSSTKDMSTEEIEKVKRQMSTVHKLSRQNKSSLVCCVEANSLFTTDFKEKMQKSTLKLHSNCRNRDSLMIKILYISQIFIFYSIKRINHELYLK
jgi:hypothetical protein